MAILNAQQAVNTRDLPELENVVNGDVLPTMIRMEEHPPLHCPISSGFDTADSAMLEQRRRSQPRGPSDLAAPASGASEGTIIVACGPARRQSTSMRSPASRPSTSRPLRRRRPTACRISRRLLFRRRRTERLALRRHPVRLRRRGPDRGRRRRRRDRRRRRQTTCSNGGARRRRDERRRRTRTT